uniref:CSON003996 protein n=1 Tax=Culicoides sonorensis TaxID=179676 RepID=A0A336L414_CULSO
MRRQMTNKSRGSLSLVLNQFSMENASWSSTAGNAIATATHNYDINLMKSIQLMLLDQNVHIFLYEAFKVPGKL